MPVSYHVDNLVGNNSYTGLSATQKLRSMAYLRDNFTLQAGDTIHWGNRREVVNMGAQPTGLFIRHGLNEDWGWTRFDTTIDPHDWVIDVDATAGTPSRKTWKTSKFAANTDPNTVTMDWETRDAAWGGKKSHLSPSFGGTHADALAYCKEDLYRFYWYHTGGTLNWLGDYENATSYVEDDAVTFNGSSYRAIGNVTGEDPDSSVNWEIITLYITLPAAVNPAVHTWSAGLANVPVGFGITANNLYLEISPALHTEGATGNFAVLVTGTGAQIWSEGTRDTGYGAISIVGNGTINGRYNNAKCIGLVNSTAYGATANGTKFFTIQPAVDTANAIIKGFTFERHGLLDIAGTPISTAGFTARSTYGIINHTTGGAHFTGAKVQNCNFRDRFGQAGNAFQLSDGRAPASATTYANYGIFLEDCKVFQEQVIPITGHIAMARCDIRPTRATVLGSYNATGLNANVYCEDSLWVFKLANAMAGLGGTSGATTYTRWFLYRNTLVDIGTGARNIGFLYFNCENNTVKAKFTGDSNIFAVLNHTDYTTNLSRLFFNYPYGGAATNFGTPDMRAITNSLMINVGKMDDLTAYTFHSYAAAYPDNGNIWWMDQADPFVNSTVGTNEDGGDFSIRPDSRLLAFSPFHIRGQKYDNGSILSLRHFK